MSARRLKRALRFENLARIPRRIAEFATFSAVGTPNADAPLELEKYAAFSAEIDASGAADKVLDREGLAKEDWARAQAFWLKRMADEASRKRFDVTTRYQALYSAKKKVFDARRRSQETKRAPIVAPPVGPVEIAAAELDKPIPVALPDFQIPEPPRVEAPPPGVAAAPYAAYAPSSREVATPPMVAAPAPVAAPSYVAAPSAAAASPTVAAPAYVAAANIAPPAVVTQPAAAQPAAAVAQPAVVAQAQPAVVTQAQPAVVAHPAAQPPGLSADRPRKHSTMVFEAEPAAQAATPFQTAPAARPAPPAAAPSRPRQDLGATMAIDASEFLQPKGDVPFRADASPVAPASAEQAGTAVIDIPKEALLPKKKQNLGATMAVDLDELRAQAMPFANTPATAPPAMRGAAAPLSPARVANQTAPLPDDDDDSPRTAIVDPSLVAAALRAATPFGASPPPAPKGPPPPVDDDEVVPKTAFFDVSQIGAQVGGNALPFAPGAPKAPPPPAASVPQARPVQHPAQHAAQHAAPAQRRFTINVFASLTAEIAEQPTDVEAIRQRYGITESEHHEESRSWTEEFQRNDDVRQRYFGIVQRYRSYIQQRKAKP